VAFAGKEAEVRSFLDFAVGDRMRLGPIMVPVLEALDFARRYDPLPFLVSEDGAAGHPFFERMAVSGWFVSALVNRLMVQEMLANPVAMMGLPGVERLRWTRPVYPGDELMVEAEVTGTRLLASRAGIGLVLQGIRVRNQDQRLVMSAALSFLVEAPERTFVMHRMLEA
jgi:acyl dehydratase